MAEAGLGPTIGPIVALMGAVVVAIPVFRRLGLGSVLGYVSAGVLIGPSLLGLFTDPQAILHFSELGVVLFLFVIGLEFRPQKLWSMRAQIFGLGLTQVILCIGLLTLAGMVVFGMAPSAAFVGGPGFVMSSTDVIMSLLQERGELASAEGQKSVSIPLFEDQMIVPLLAVVAWLSPATSGAVGFLGFAITLGALAGIILAGRYLLDPFFALLARARTRDVLTAGALLVVLGAALVMEAVGLSMAMGAFMAGVMLSGSSYRHQIETDVEPFRGLLMGLFFLAVGMSLDLSVVAENWELLIAMLALVMLVKMAGTYAVARIFGSSNAAARKRALLFAQGGEFAFVLYAAAAASDVIDARLSAIFSTVVIQSMALTPLVLAVAGRVAAARPKSTEGLEEPRDLKGQVLIVGFGRFG
jgi:glutathione-regulated potassium-efflux system protein KefB